ncbi:MAG: PDZ domain-containing protein, partial [Proteobacteria bacterium]|nr:PDZ domain-containing protein [Pseudomonadota bacterium]
MVAPLSLLLACLAFGGTSEQAAERAVDLIDRLYLYPEKLDHQELLFSAGTGLANRLDWLVADVDGEVLHLRHGNGDELGLVTVESMDGLPEALRTLESLVTKSAYDVGDLDVRLELLKGMTYGLDRYSRVLEGERLERFDVRLKGTLVGVGATLRLVDNRLRTEELVTGGPAELGGLLVGDILMRIDGRSTVNMPVKEATRRIRGQKETDVVLTVERDGETLDLILTRAEVTVPNVHTRVLDENVGYIKIDHVSQRTVTNLKAALSSLGDLGALAKGLVIDLRGNTGGSMKEAARSADEFLKSGMLLRTAGPDGGRVQNLQARMDAEDAGTELAIPIAVLMDERTASGAEILAGALFQLDRVVLVGTRSYGKGTVQKKYNLDDDTSFKLTVAQYLLADDRVIADVGLVPDVVLASVVLDGYGVRYRGWDADRTHTPWEEIVPNVIEYDGWRDAAEWETDLARELARRAVAETADATRGATLQALKDAAAQVRVEQEGHLVSAFEAHGINWSPALEDGPDSEARVHLTASRDSGDADVIVVEAEVENTGQQPLARTLIELECDTFSAWSGLVVPVGWVEVGEKVTGKVSIPLRPGINPRQDEVEVRLRADSRLSLLVGEEVLEAGSSPLPRIRVSARLVGEGEDKRASVAVRNFSPYSIEGVEVYFEHPGDLDVELIDRASRVPELAPRGTSVFDLAVWVGPEAPDVVPLNLVVDTDDFNELAEWPLNLPLDGSEVVVEAPSIAASNHVLSAPVGGFVLPVVA